MRTRGQIGALAVVFAVISFWPFLAHATKRKPAPRVPPVMWEGIEYHAKAQSVWATNVLSGRKLWATQVYNGWIIPGIEMDAEWVFISDMQLRDGRLWVKNQRGKEYWLDLQTGRVEGSWSFPACLLLVAAFIFWVWKTRATGKAAGASAGNRSARAVTDQTQPVAQPPKT